MDVVQDLITGIRRPRIQLATLSGRSPSRRPVPGERLGSRPDRLLGLRQAEQANKGLIRVPLSGSCRAKERGVLINQTGPRGRPEPREALRDRRGFRDRLGPLAHPARPERPGAARQVRAARPSRRPDWSYGCHRPDWPYWCTGATGPTGPSGPSGPSGAPGAPGVSGYTTATPSTSTDQWTAATLKPPPAQPARRCSVAASQSTYPIPAIRTGVRHIELSV